RHRGTAASVAQGLRGLCVALWLVCVAGWPSGWGLWVAGVCGASRGVGGGLVCGGCRSLFGPPVALSALATRREAGRAVDERGTVAADESAEPGRVVDLVAVDAAQVRVRAVLAAVVSGEPAGDAVGEAGQGVSSGSNRGGVWPGRWAWSGRVQVLGSQGSGVPGWGQSGQARNGQSGPQVMVSPIERVRSALSSPLGRV